jgi:hypothetical protein
MNNYYSIKNFRVFDKDGVIIPIKPLTILTGCNSSGKSSVVKSMVLFDAYLQKLQDGFNNSNNLDLTKYKLDFSNNESITLGGFNSVLHRGANQRSSKGSPIDFGYKVHSHLLGEDVYVSFSFVADEKDDLDNGYLSALSIQTPNGDIIYKSTGKHKKGNLNLVLFNFHRYVFGQFVLWRNRDDKRNLGYHSPTAYDRLESVFETKYGEEAMGDIIFRENIIPQLYPTLQKDKTQTFAAKYLNNDLKLLKLSRDSGTIFYVPLLEKIADWKKERIIRYVAKFIQDGEENDLVNLVFNDFYESEDKTFGEYFQRKESEFLMINDGWNNKSMWLFSSNVLAIPNHDHFTENYIYNLNNDPNVIDFIKVYDSLMFLDTKDRQGNASDTHLDLYSRRKPRVFEMFKDYVSQVIREVITISMPHNLSYVSSSLVNIKRIYTLDSSDSFSQLLKNYFSAKQHFENVKVVDDCVYNGESDEFEEKRYNPGSFINHWIRKFEIGYSVNIAKDKEGASVTIRLYESEKDKKGKLLSELGYGITQLFVILLRIETAILEAPRYCGGNCGLIDPTQLEKEFTPIHRVPLPIAIEEPEVHQHPKFQSMLADLFVDAYQNYDIHFIIETHSEYLIRKLQNLVADKTISNDNVSLIYVYDTDPEKRPVNTPQVNPINILPDGRLADKFGEGFFDEADRLAMDLFKM